MAGEEVVKLRVRNLEIAVQKIETAVSSIAENLQTLSKLESRHIETRETLDRAFKTIEINRVDYEKSCDRVDDRLRKVELQMPILLMTSHWIVGGTIAVVGAAFSALGLMFYAMLPFLGFGK